MRLLYLELFVDSETKQAFYLNLENNKTYVFKNDRRKKVKKINCISFRWDSQ